jgi:hypothetical protein
MKQSLFFCLSEPLEEKIPILDDGSGPIEEYRIAELVVAPSRAKAKWLAWKTDNPSHYDSMRDMPKFSIRKIANGFVTTPRVVSNEKAWEQFWGRV